MPKRDKPDEVFEAPGFRIERRGRFTTVTTHRTPEEHQRWIKHILDLRPRLLEEIENATRELIELCHQFNSLELLAQLWFLNSVGDPNKYKEYSYEGRLPYVEHLAVLEMKDTEYAICTAKMPGRAEIEKAQELLHTIFNNTSFYYASEGLEPDRVGPVPRLEQLRVDTILYELIVRSPTYGSHWGDILRGIFGPAFITGWMQQKLGFDIDQALKCVQATSGLVMKRIEERGKKAIQSANELREYVKQFKRTGKFTGPQEARDIVNRIRNMRGKQAKRTIQAIATSWAFYELHETCSFTASELASQAGVAPAVAEAYLSLFSLCFGTTPSDYLLPNPTSPVRLRPVIRYNGKFFCPATHLLIWALKPQIETCLKSGAPSSADSDVRRWERYQKHRGDFLVQRGLKYLRALLPRAEIHEKLKYTISEGGAQKEVELDGLVLFDRYAFLIEGKSGELSFSARRGGPLRLVDDLKELVAEPHRQALRAKAYISSTERPVFQGGDGSIVCLEKDKYVQYFLITLTLEALDVFTKELYQLRELGIFGTSELPWAVSINDLRIIAETIKLPTQFAHYLKWRLYLNQAGHVIAQSELDWLGYYLAEGPKLLKVPEGYDYMVLETYTTSFDDFYLYEQGERTVPAERPSQPSPPEFVSLLTSLESMDGSGYTAAGEALLSLGFEERQRLASQLRELFLMRGDVKESRLVGEEIVVSIGTDRESHESCGALAYSVATSTGKTTVVIMLNKEDLNKIGAWAVHELDRNP